MEFPYTFFQLSLQDQDKKKRFNQGTVVNALEWKATAASPGKCSLVGHSKPFFFPFIK